MLAFYPFSARSAPVIDDTIKQNNIMERMSKYIAARCNMCNSEKKRLTKYLIKSANEYQQCVQLQDHCNNLNKKIEEGIRKEFGEQVYKEYMSFRICAISHIRMKYISARPVKRLRH
jgi:hypothetical protein